MKSLTPARGPQGAAARTARNHPLSITAEPSEVQRRGQKVRHSDPEQPRYCRSGETGRVRRLDSIMSGLHKSVRAGSSADGVVRVHLIAGGFPVGSAAGHDHDWIRTQLTSMLTTDAVGVQ